MASGYTAQSATVGSFTVRFYWMSIYNASNNTSTITIIPQVYNTGYYGGDLWACGYNLSSPGIYLGGSRAYSFDASWGTGYNLKCSANQNSWTNFLPYTGSIITITVPHDANGVASTTVRFLGTIVPTNFESYKKSLDSGNLTISFTESAPYSITYNANGGSGAPSSQGVYYGVSYNLSGTIPTRTGYTFLGWATSSTATEATYQPCASVKPNGNLTLYAVWEKKTFVLSISAGAGSSIEVKRGSTTLSDGDTVTYGDELAITFSASEGYNLGAHTVNGSDFTSGGSHTVTGAVTVASAAALKIFALSISAGRGSSIRVKRGGTTLSDGDTITYGDELTITFSASEGYDLDAHTVNGSVFSSGGSHIVTGAVSVVSTATLKTFALSISAGRGTSILVMRGGTTLTDGATITYGDVIEISVAATAGYLLREVELNGGALVSPVVVSANISVAATAIPAGAIIAGSASNDTYQIVIDTGSAYEVFIPYMDNGQSWELY